MTVTSRDVKGLTLLTVIAVLSSISSHVIMNPLSWADRLIYFLWLWLVVSGHVDQQIQSFDHLVNPLKPTVAIWVHIALCARPGQAVICNFWYPGTLTLMAERQSARMSKIQHHYQHPVPDRVKPSFVIFDMRALWRLGLSVRVPGCQKLQMTA